MTSSSSSTQPWVVAAGLGLAALCCLCMFGAIGLGVLQLNRAGSLAAVTATFPPRSASPASPARTLTATSVPATLTPFFAASATPSVELIQTATARAAWPVVISDTFSARNLNDWSLGTQTGQLATVQRLLTEGVYRWNVETHSDVFIRAGNSLPRVDDFYFAVDVKQLSGPSSTNYGVVFRERDDVNMYYYFSVQEVGRCTLIRIDNDESTPLLRAFCGEAVRPGEVNRLAISADGAHMLFYVNGQLIGEVEDARLAAGGLTLAVGVGEANQTAAIEFDNVELRAP